MVHSDSALYTTELNKMNIMVHLIMNLITKDKRLTYNIGCKFSVYCGNNGQVNGEAIVWAILTNLSHRAGTTWSLAYRAIPARSGVTQ